MNRKQKKWPSNKGVFLWRAPLLLFIQRKSFFAHVPFPSMLLKTVINNCLLLCFQLLTQVLNRVTAGSNLFENVTRLHLPGNVISCFCFEFKLQFTTFPFTRMDGELTYSIHSFNQSFIHFYFLRTRNCRPVSHSRCCDRNLADAVVGWHNWKVWIVLTKNQRAKRLVLKNSMLQICSRCYCFRSFIFFSPNC